MDEKELQKMREVCIVECEKLYNIKKSLLKQIKLFPEWKSLGTNHPFKVIQRDIQQSIEGIEYSIEKLTLSVDHYLNIEIKKERKGE